MDERSLALIAEHEPHGWRVATPLKAIHAFEPVDGYWMHCSCGWTGWIMRDPEHEPKEQYEDFQ